MHYIRWQKTGEGPSNERLDLEASPRQRRLRESSVMGKAKKEEAKEEEIVEDEGERYGEQIQQNVREPIPPGNNNTVIKTTINSTLIVD